GIGMHSPTSMTSGKPRPTGAAGWLTSPRLNRGASPTFAWSRTPMASGSALPDSSTLASWPLMAPVRQKMRRSSRMLKNRSASLPLGVALEGGRPPVLLFLAQGDHFRLELRDLGSRDRRVVDLQARQAGQRQRVAADAVGRRDGGAKEGPRAGEEAREGVVVI